VPRKLMTMHGDQRHSVIVDNTRRSIHTWQDGDRNPSLTALLVLELCAIFLAPPLAAKGLPIARAVADTLVLAVVIVVMLSHRWHAIILILLGLAAIAASISDSHRPKASFARSPPPPQHGGRSLATWAPG
jgi:hypothetical protein